MLKEIINENKGSVILASGISIMVSLLLVGMALMTSRLIDYAINQDLNGLVRQVVLFMGAWAVTIVLNYFSEVYKAKSVQKMNASLRERMTDKLMSLDYEAYHKEDTGTYVSWLTNDVTQIESDSFNNLFYLIESIASVTFAACALIYIHYMVAIVSLLLSGLMFMVPKLMSKKVQKGAQIFSSEQEKFVARVKSTILGHEVLYSYNLLSELKQKILRQSHEVEEIKFNYKKTKTLSQNLVLISRVLSQVTNIALVGLLAVLGKTTVGMIFPVTELSGTLFNGIAGSTQYYMLLKSSKPLFDKFKVVEAVPTHYRDAKPFSQAIKLKNVSFSYDNQDIFKDLSLTFEKGKKYAIVGESGSGKTTLIKMILGHLKDYTGVIEVDGVDVREYGESVMRDQLAYIGQQVYLFKDSIKDNVTLHQLFSEKDFEQAIEESCLSEFVKAANEKELLQIEENGGNISGGQKQRIAIARALIRKRPIIILDEGTSALDQKNSKEVESILPQNKELTVLLITHHLNGDLVQYFDEVINLGEVKSLINRAG